MLWIFAILGSLTLMAILFGMATAFPRRKRPLAIHAAALILIALAWAVKHTSVWGWLCLALAMAVEVIAWRMDQVEADGNNESLDAGSPTTQTPQSEVTDETGSEHAEDLQAREMPLSTIPPTEETPQQPPAAVTPLAHEDRANSLPSQAPVEPDTEPTVPSVPPSETPEAEGAQFIDDDVNEAPTPIASQPEKDEDEAHPPIPPEKPQRPETSEAADAPNVHEAPASSEESKTSEAPPESADIEITEPQSPAITHEIADEPDLPRELTTLVLFRSSINLSAEVLLASLRRSGQRDAALVDASDSEGTTRFSSGGISLSLMNVPDPCDSEQIAVALAQTTDWPEGVDIVAEHESHSIVTSTYQPHAPLDQVVRLHHHAHAALSEFTPVVAVLWPAAGRLVSADQLPECLAMASDPYQPMAKTCTLIREFPLEGQNAGMVLIDSVGLHAFDLPDIQIISNGKPDQSVMTEMHRLVDRFFTSGCDIEDGADCFMEGCGAYRVTHTRSAFAPDRKIVQLTPK